VIFSSTERPLKPISRSTNNCLGKEPGEKGAGLAQREIRTCAACGTKFSVASDTGFCPVCVLLGAVDDEPASAEALGPVSGSERSSGETESLSIVRRFENYAVMLDQDGKPIELGRGAMGITYKALDINLRFPVTLKVISEKYVGDEAARRRFLREARAAAKVRHPNVASVFHLGRSSGDYFYAMEFVAEETPESLIKRCGRLEVKLALEIVAQVAAGLTAVDEENLVHRDIKPTNIMVRLTDDGRVTAKIIDLGLAKGVSEPGSESAISTAGGFAGTPAFASPEQFAGVGLDIRSDLYSLGVTLWEMLVGRAPFCGSPAEVMYQHQHAPLPLEQLSGLPQPVVVLLEVLLEKDPAERIQGPAAQHHPDGDGCHRCPSSPDSAKPEVNLRPATDWVSEDREISRERTSASDLIQGSSSCLANDRAGHRRDVILAVNGVFIVGRPATESRYHLSFGPQL